MFAASKTAAVSSAANYIEDVFSTYLYTGNGSTQTITNGIDLSTFGGMVWLKARDNAFNNELSDTVRGSGKYLLSNSTASQYTSSTHLNAFTSSGFTVGSDSSVNASTGLMASWTFRKQPKFFDVVTYTGNGTAGRSISHNLGSTPGCIIIKSTTRVSDWVVYHRSVGSSATLILNGSSASADYGNNISSVTSTSFNVTDGSDSNANGDSYVAYIYAHNAGGFGLTGTDNVISCGSVTLDGSGNGNIDLGYEPQWVLFKKTSGADDWRIWDTMRGFYAIDPSVSSSANPLSPNATTPENVGYFNPAYVTPTGFSIRSFSPSATYIYIAIRKGPMKVPTDATKVFTPVATTANGATSITANFPVDLSIIKGRANAYNWWWSDRLRSNQYAAYLGTSNFLFSNSTDSEQVYTDTTPGVMMASSTGIIDYAVLPSGYSGLYYNLRRSPSVFDIVCFVGDGTSNRSINHNLGVVPELFFTKRRSSGGSGDVNWGVYSKDRPSADDNLILNSNTGWYNAGTGGWFGTGTLSSTLFPAGRASGNFGNLSNAYYVTYLFATCAGVSKVGSYTGTGSTLQVNCGFTSGSRLVMIKRTDTTGDWYVWDSARGIVSGNDPYMLFNSQNIDVTNTDYVDTYSAGFEISSTAPAAINASGGTFIFLAIA